MKRRVATLVLRPLLTPPTQIAPPRLHGFVEGRCVAAGARCQPAASMR